jgi:hypothetical protein
MNYYAVLKKHYDGKIWGIAEDYSTLDWGDKTPKPSDEQLKEYWNNMKHEYLADIMREERNQLLKDCDFRALPDFSNTNKEAWLAYRQSLRDLPTVWTPGMAFPKKPE